MTSLQNHLALEALLSQHGENLHITYLFRTVYLAYLLRDMVEESCQFNVLLDAEAALYECSRRAEDSGSWLLSDAGIEALKIVLTLHDLQLQSVPAYVYESACRHLLEDVTRGVDVFPGRSLMLPRIAREERGFLPQGDKVQPRKYYLPR